MFCLLHHIPLLICPCPLAQPLSDLFSGHGPYLLVTSWSLATLFSFQLPPKPVCIKAHLKDTPVPLCQLTAVHPASLSFEKTFWAPQYETGLSGPSSLIASSVQWIGLVRVYLTSASSTKL